MPAAQAETKFGVIITVVEPPEQVAWCLRHIRETYSEVPVVMISDGVSKREYWKLADQFGVRFVEGEKLKRADRGGLWWQRTLTWGLSTGAEFILKIDPDTKIQRRVGSWPDFDISGTIAGHSLPWEHIQGGIQLFSQLAVIRLLTSGFFCRSKLQNPGSYAWDDTLLIHAKETNYLCTDAVLSAARRELGLSRGNWAEVHSTWKELTADPGRYAIVHPCKFKSEEF